MSNTAQNRKIPNKMPLPAQSDESDLWLYSYSDLMTLILCFFVLNMNMSGMTSAAQKKVQKEISSALSKDKTKQPQEEEPVPDERKMRALQLMMTMAGAGTNEGEFVEKIEKSFNKWQDEKTTDEFLKAEILEKLVPTEANSGTNKGVNENLIEIVLPEVTLFANGTDDLSPEAKMKLAELGENLSSAPGIVNIAITGHTDSRPPSARSKYSDNWALSAARAGTVTKVLAESGINPKIIKSSGVADTQPLFPEYNPDGSKNLDAMNRNRRVTIKLYLRSE